MSQPLREVREASRGYLGEGIGRVLDDASESAGEGERRLRVPD